MHAASLPPARLIATLLDAPDHIQALRKLEPTAFARAIQSVGMSDAGYHLAMATAEQNLAVIDRLAWRTVKAKREQQFDGRGFALWLEALLEWGDDTVAHRIAELPEATIIAGFCAQFRVFDFNSFVHERSHDSDAAAQTADRILECSLSLDIEQHTIIAADELTWDVALACLWALDRMDHSLVLRVLEACEWSTRDGLQDDEASYPLLTTSITASGTNVIASPNSSGSRQKTEISGRFNEPSGNCT